MQVMCNEGHEDLLIQGNIYTVVGITSKGNYILQEVQVPEGFTSFSADRFEILFPTDDWTEEMEEKYWEEQPSDIVL